VYVGQRRTALLRFAPFKPSWSLKEVLSNLDLQVEQVVSTMSFSHQDIAAALSDRVRMPKVTKESMADSMRAIKSSPGEYSLSVRLVFSMAYTHLKLHNLILAFS
jgi:phosphatidylinositol glycan class S